MLKYLLLTLLPLLAPLALRASTPDPAAPPDVTVPAVIRTTGNHGPIRTDLAITNRSAEDRQVLLQLLSRAGGLSDQIPLVVPAYSRIAVRDVVAALYPGQSDPTDEGALLVRGFVPEAPGDLEAETYYDNGASGRVGTVLPVFSESPAAGSRVLLSATFEGDPRLNAFSIPADPAAVVPVTLELRVAAPGQPPQTFPFTFPAGVYVSARLSDLLPSFPAETLVTFATDDPALHVMLTRSDPVSGSPFVLASR